MRGANGRNLVHTVALLAAAACGGGGDDVGKLDGGWTGTIDASGATYTASGSFTYDKEADLLSGELTVSDADPPHTYAIRRSEEISGVLYLELTDITDGTRGLDLDGELKKDFNGTATLRYPCPEGTCGYEGPFSLVRAGTTTGTGPSDTGPGGSGTP